MRGRLSPDRVPALPERVIAAALGDAALLVGELVSGAEVVHVHVDRFLHGAGLRDDGDHALWGVDVIPRGGGVGHALIQALEVERLGVGQRLADPLLVAVIIQLDGAARLGWSWAGR